MGLFDASGVLSGLDMSRPGLLLLLLGAVFGLVIGFIPAAYVSDQARLAFGKRRYRRFDDGSYRLYAPSPEFRDTIIRWEMSVRSRLLGSRTVELFSTWEDKGLHACEYRGPIVVDDRYTIIRLNAVVRRSGKLVRDGKTFKATPVENDPAVVVIEKATGTWSIRPVVVSGFDSQGHCYSAIAIMTEEHAELSEAEVRSLLADTSFYLDYGDVRRRVSQRLHAQAMTAQRMQSRDAALAGRSDLEPAPEPEVLKAHEGA
jgi:hypothetical protein